MKEEIREKFETGEIKKHRRRSHENYELIATKSESVKEIDRIAKQSQANTLDKVLLHNQLESLPYTTETFGMLELKEYAQMALVGNVEHGLQLFTIDSSNLANIRLSVYKIKRSYQTVA